MCSIIEEAVRYVGYFKKDKKFYVVYIDKKCTSEITQVPARVTKSTYLMVKKILGQLNNRGIE